MRGEYEAQDIPGDEFWVNEREKADYDPNDEERRYDEDDSYSPPEHKHADGYVGTHSHPGYPEHTHS